MVQYLTWGLATLILVMIVAMVSPSNVDWTKMPDPRSPQYQMKVMLALFMCIFLWPLVLFAVALVIKDDLG